MLEIIKKRYNIIRKIGKGGMADIYLATQKGNDKKIAIKVMEPSSRNDLIKQKRFEHEIKILKVIDSPYVAKMFDAEITENYAYIVMEYVDGYILRDYVVKYTRLTIDKTVDFMKQLTLGFDEIHNNNVIHRDIKSQNIMVGPNGRIKIIDFGIAINDETERLTKTNILIGSPQYVSPELINQEDPTHYADIYALGVLMYEMLTGDVPFKGKDPLAILKKHQNVEVPKITKAFPNVPQSIENIIAKATAKNKKLRYNTMFDFYLDLKSCLDQNRANEKPVDLKRKKPKKSFIDIINSKFLGGIIIAILFLVIVSLIIIFAMKEF